MTTFYEPLERNVWFRDRNGIPATTKHKDSTETYAVDFSDALASGETISSQTTTGHGVTVSASSITSGIGGSNRAVSMTIAESDGYVEVTAVTSASRTLVRQMRFMGVPVAEPESDYRG